MEATFAQAGISAGLQEQAISLRQIKEQSLTIIGSIDNYIGEVQDYLQQNEQAEAVQNLLYNSVGMQMMKMQVQRNKKMWDEAEKSKLVLEGYANSNTSTILQRGYSLIMGIRTSILGKQSEVQYKIAYDRVGTQIHQVTLNESEYLASIKTVEAGLEGYVQYNKDWETSSTMVNITEKFASFYETLMQDQEAAELALRNALSTQQKNKIENTLFNLDIEEQKYIKRYYGKKNSKKVYSAEELHQRWIKTKTYNELMQGLKNISKGNYGLINFNTWEKKNYFNLNDALGMVKHLNKAGNFQNFINAGYLYELVTEYEGNFSGKTAEELLSLYKKSTQNTKAFYKGGDVGNYQLKILRNGGSGNRIRLQTIIDGLLQVRAVFARTLLADRIENQGTQVLTSACESMGAAEAQAILKELQALFS